MDWGDREEGNEGHEGAGELRDAKSAFEAAVFGQNLASELEEEENWTDEDVIELPNGFDGEKLVPEDLDPPNLDVGVLTTYAVDDPNLQSPPSQPPSLVVTARPPITPQNRQIIDLITPSPLNQTRARSAIQKRTATSQSKVQKSGGLLAIDASDEEVDFFSKSPSVRSSGIQRRLAGSRVKRTPRDSSVERTSRNSSVERMGSVERSKPVRRVIVIESEEEEDYMLDIKVEKGFDGGKEEDSGDDTLGRCGDVGYRCSKAFCFQCVA